MHHSCLMGGGKHEELKSLMHSNTKKAGWYSVEDGGAARGGRSMRRGRDKRWSDLSGLFPDMSGQSKSLFTSQTTYAALQLPLSTSSRWGIGNGLWMKFFFKKKVLLKKEEGGGVTFFKKKCFIKKSQKSFKICYNY